jgi:hypothetical protein
VKNHLRDRVSDLLQRISHQKRVTFPFDGILNPHDVDGTNNRFKQQLGVAITPKEIAQVEIEILNWAKEEPVVPQSTVDNLISKVNLAHLLSSPPIDIKNNDYYIAKHTTFSGKAPLDFIGFEVTRVDD